ncbi:Glucosaminyl phosphatidylinositol (GlcN-PI) nositol acylation protein [Microsporum audouinii]
MAESYKARKEAFVSNLSGSNVWDINTVSAVVPSAVLLWSVLQSRRSLFTPYELPALIADFLLAVASVLFAITLYSSSLVVLNVLLLSPAALLLLSTKPQQVRQNVKPPAAKPGSEKSTTERSHGSDTALDVLPQRPFLTNYRAGLMITTCLSILAVDFNVFPRRFAKVENWGTSLMDLGVGSFVFSGGVVSARSILGGGRAPQESFAKRLLASARHSIPLLVLGLIRLYSVKGLDYAEHVTEYGVHWNFFFTLGLLPPFVEIFHALTTLISWYEALSLIVIGAYQVALESTSLKEYILVSPRGRSLLSKNREGVFSFLGYLAIFLSGRAAGLRIIPRKSRKALLMQLASWSAVWATLFFLNSSYFYGYGAGIPVSRRLANMPYVFWVNAFNMTHMLLYCLIETFVFPSVEKASNKTEEAEKSGYATSRIMRAFNKNGLAIFLVANLLTGAVNLGMNTLDARKELAMAVLMLYSIILTGIALALDFWNVKLRL